MAAPVILTTQSVLEYLQWQPFEFQPYATNSPSYWNASPLPTGVTFNPANGRVAGPATKPGVFIFSLLAGNIDGPSVAQIFTLGIEASAWIAPVDAIDVTIELGTGAVSFSQAAVTDGSTNVDASQMKATDLKPLLWVKRGDTKLFHIRFQKSGVVADIDLSSLNLTWKEFEPEEILVESLGFARVGTGTDTYYRLGVQISGDALSGELGSVESDLGTHLIGLAEFEWKWVNTLFPAVAGSPVRSSSLNFALGIARDLNPDA